MPSITLIINAKSNRMVKKIKNRQITAKKKHIQNHRQMNRNIYNISKLKGGAVSIPLIPMSCAPDPDPVPAPAPAPAPDPVPAPAPDPALKRKPITPKSTSKLKSARRKTLAPVLASQSAHTQKATLSHKATLAHKARSAHNNNAKLLHNKKAQIPLKSILKKTPAPKPVSKSTTVPTPKPVSKSTTVPAPAPTPAPAPAPVQAIKPAPVPTLAPVPKVVIHRNLVNHGNNCWLSSILQLFGYINNFIDDIQKYNGRDDNAILIKTFFKNLITTGEKLNYEKIYTFIVKEYNTIPGHQIIAESQQDPTTIIQEILQIILVLFNINPDYLCFNVINNRNKSIKFYDLLIDTYQNKQTKLQEAINFNLKIKNYKNIIPPKKYLIIKNLDRNFVVCDRQISITSNTYKLSGLITYLPIHYTFYKINDDGTGILYNDMKDEPINVSKTDLDNIINLNVKDQIWPSIALYEQIIYPKSTSVPAPAPVPALTPGPIKPDEIPKLTIAPMMIKGKGKDTETEDYGIYINSITGNSDMTSNPKLDDILHWPNIEKTKEHTQTHGDGIPFGQFLTHEPYDAKTAYSDHAPIYFQNQNIITWNVANYGNIELTSTSKTKTFNHKFNLDRMETHNEYLIRLKNIVNAIRQMIDYVVSINKSSPLIFCQELPTETEDRRYFTDQLTQNELFFHDFINTQLPLENQDLSECDVICNTQNSKNTILQLSRLHMKDEYSKTSTKTHTSQKVITPSEKRYSYYSTPNYINIYVNMHVQMSADFIAEAQHCIESIKKQLSWTTAGVEQYKSIRKIYLVGDFNRCLLFQQNLKNITGTNNYQLHTLQMKIFEKFYSSLGDNAGNAEKYTVDGILELHNPFAAINT